MQTPNKSKNILIVSANNYFTKAISGKLSNNEFAILYAADCACALAEIENRQIDLIITGLTTAADNNFNLLNRLNSNKITIPVIVCAHKIPQIDANTLDSFAAFNFISENVETIDPSVLNKRISNSLGHGSKGHISGVSLASFLQLIELDRKTCTLRIKCLEERGVLYFQEGEIIDAVYKKSMGEQAALDIVGWNPVEIDIWENCRKTDQNIDSPLGFLLIEGARRSDEKNLKNQELSKNKEPTIDQPQISAQKNTTSPPKLSPNEQRILDHLIEATANYDIESLFIGKADGTALTAENCTTDMVKLIQNTTASTLDLASAFNYQLPKQIIIDLDSTSRLLILIGPEIQVGIGIARDQPTSILAGDLAPIIKRLHFSAQHA